MLEFSSPARRVSTDNRMILDMNEVGEDGMYRKCASEYEYEQWACDRHQIS